MLQVTVQNGLPIEADVEQVDADLDKIMSILMQAGWSCTAARNKGLSRLAMAMRGSKGAVDMGAFKSRLEDHVLGVILPTALLAAAGAHPLARFRDMLGDAAVLLAANGGTISRSLADDVRRAGRAIQNGYPAALACVFAAEAVLAAAGFAYTVAVTGAASVTHATGGSRDETLAAFAEALVQILIQLRAPGALANDLSGLQP